VIKLGHKFNDIWGCTMAVSYKKLFHLLIEKEMTSSQLMQKAGFSANIITRLKRNEYVSMESLENICRVMNCGVDDILEFIYEKETED
jgi:DNA-binding Xre family transcriptional regulator